MNETMYVNDSRAKFHVIIKFPEVLYHWEECEKEEKSNFFDEYLRFRFRTSRSQYEIS